MRQMAVGNNLGNPDSLLIENRSEPLVYHGSIESIFEKDIAILIAAWRSLNVESLVAEDFKEWYKIENDPTLEDIYVKKMEILAKINPVKYLELHQKILEVKIKYSYLFKKIEEIYKLSDNTATSTEIEINDGVPNFGSRNILIHNFPLTGINDVDIEGIISRKELGILSSEWFGRLEKYGECRFCVSFAKKNGMSFLLDHGEETDKKLKVSSFSPNSIIKSSISLIIDADSPELQELLKLDYFAFLRNKNNNNLLIYTEEELLILNGLYEWNNSLDSSDLLLSKLNGFSGSGQRSSGDNLDWLALPGGVSSKFVIGIISNDVESDFIAMEAGKIFSVPVMNKYGEIIQNKLKL